MALRRNTSLLALACAILAFTVPAAALTNRCPQYPECKFTFTVESFEFFFDLNPLCQENSDYIAIDPQNHTYAFNICGSTTQSCNPTGWRSQFTYGVAVQSWGKTPACPPMACENAYDGSPECCTADCQVLGVGEPQLALEDPNNPVDGGIKIMHRRMVPNPADPFVCPNDPVTGLEMGRQVTYHIACDHSIQGLVVTAVNQNQTNDCDYHIWAISSFGCGCTPQCDNMECGFDQCFGQCGTCGVGQVCTDDQKCCAPDCTESNCGSDGCGGSCGECPEFYECDGHVCVSSKPPPKTNDTGAVVGAFFGGIFTGLVVVAVGAFIWKRRGMRGSASQRAAATTSAFGGDGGYGSLS